MAIIKNFKDFNEQDLLFFESTLELFENRHDLIKFRDIVNVCEIEYKSDKSKFEFEFRINHDNIELCYYEIIDYTLRHPEIEFTLNKKSNKKYYERFENIMNKFIKIYEESKYNKYQKIMDFLNKKSVRKRKLDNLNEKR